MGDFMAVVAQAVGAAAVQEAMSRTVSFVLGKRKEKASQGQYPERFRKAVHEVEFVLERTAKMPITEVSLLRDRIELKRDFIQAISLLSIRHKKRQAPQGQQEIMPAVTGLVSRSAMFFVSSFIGMTKDELSLSCDDVERFEQFSDSARNILTRVESGCSLRRWMHFSSPLVRHLLEWKSLRCITEEADKLRDFSMWRAPSEGERGVEAVVAYRYLDRKRPEKCFFLGFVIRLSESTDIAGIAINCLRSLTYQFNLVAHTAIGELALLVNLQEVSHSHASPWVGIEEQRNKFIQKYRPDPLCCKAKGHGSCAKNVVSSELSHVFPEEVILLYFSCYISAPEYSLRSSSKKSVERNRRPPLQLQVRLAPHYLCNERQQASSYAVERIGDKGEELIDASMQQVMGESVSRALNCFVRQPMVNKYKIGWATRHGGIAFRVEKPRAGALKTSGRSKS